MVLIIYYKQITEGYEDQDRFQILMKVGMTQKEVRQTINSQVMTVFFLPLVAAGIHTAFAFPMIEKMVHLLAFSDRKFLILVTVCSYLVFALFYIIVYMVTSKQYYKIVSGKQEESLFLNSKSDRIELSEKGGLAYDESHNYYNWKTVRKWRS